MSKLHKRIITATALGILTGIWHHYSINSGVQVPLPQVIGLVGSIGIIGFMIGISALKMNWFWHGAFIGLIGSLPASLPPLILGTTHAFFILALYGIFYGIVIELFTTIVFKLGLKGN